MGNLTFTLNGKRLKGRWHLVRIRGKRPASDGGRPNRRLWASRDRPYVVLRVEMHRINPGLVCHRSRRCCGDREVPTLSLAILNVRYGKPTRNFYYSELPSGINEALEATCNPNVPGPQGTPSDLNIYPSTTGPAETFLPSGNAMARALYECNFARAALQINSRTKVQGSSVTAARR
jgi:hypothetical protein